MAEVDSVGLEALSGDAVKRQRRWFGTDGVRGVVGETLTAELVERLGRAATLWSGRGRVLVGRDTRGSGPELEAALTRGIVDARRDSRSRRRAADARGRAALPGSRARRLRVAQPSGVQRRQGLRPRRAQAHRRGRARDRGALRRARARGGAIEDAQDAVQSYVDHILEHFGSDLSGLRIAVDCANGAYSAIAPAVFERLGADVTALAASPDGTNINDGCGATDLGCSSRPFARADFDLGVAFDGDGDRMLAVDADGEIVDGDQIVAICALALGVDLVAVTTMTNLGFHRLMAERGIRVVTTDVGDRYVLEALRREGGVLGGEQSGPPDRARRACDGRRPRGRADALPRRSTAARSPRRPP